MTKSQLIERVASRTRHISRREIAIAVDTLFGSMTQALGRGERIELRGFGSFRVGLRQTRKGFNPKTREPVQIPALRKPLFRVAKKLRERINHPTDHRSAEGTGLQRGGEREQV